MKLGTLFNWQTRQTRCFVRYCSTPPPPQNESQARLRREFLRLEEELERKVDYARLDPAERLIHQTHKEAVEGLHFTYRDPESGLLVVTRLRHFLKGSCCGNACRHCVYEHEGVMDAEVKARREFNTAFWKDKPSPDKGMGDEWSVGDEELQNYLDTLLPLVSECGDIIESAISSQTNVEINEKSENLSEGNSSSVLTETDIKVEKHLINGLKQKFPDHQFIGEESSEENVKELGNAPTWIIDPIDGTMNFVHSNPLVCTSVGLTVNKKLVLGVVNCPLIGKLYHAVKGLGAFCNGRRIGVSKVTDISKAMLIMELPAGANKEKKAIALRNLDHILEKAHAVRAPGPAAMDIAWVGSGSADGFFHQGIHSWDMAAGAIIVKEAGGTVLSTDGGEFDLMSRGIVVASSEALAKRICSFVEIYKTPRDEPSPCFAL